MPGHRREAPGQKLPGHDTRATTQLPAATAKAASRDEGAAATTMPTASETAPLATPLQHPHHLAGRTCDTAPPVTNQLPPSPHRGAPDTWNPRTPAPTRPDISQAAAAAATAAALAPPHDGLPSGTHGSGLRQPLPTRAASTAATTPLSTTNQNPITTTPGKSLVHSPPSPHTTLHSSHTMDCPPLR